MPICPKCRQRFLQVWQESVTCPCGYGVALAVLLRDHAAMEEVHANGASLSRWVGSRPRWGYSRRGAGGPWEGEDPRDAVEAAMKEDAP